MKMTKNLIGKIPKWLVYTFGFFITTRLLLLAIGYLTIKLSIDLPPFPSHIYAYTGHSWLDLWGHWDTGWYHQIASFGYSSQTVQAEGSVGQATYAFFPLYPAIVGLLAKLVGSVYVSGLIISNLCLFISSYLIYKIIAIDNSRETALRAIKYLFIFPTAFLFSSMLTESLYITLILATFYFAKKENWLLVGITGFLLALTRSIGVLILIPVLLEFLKSINFDFKKIRIDLLFLILIPLGLLVFSYYNYRLTGDWLAFMHVQAAWGRQTDNPFLYLTKGLLLKEGIYSFVYALIALLGYLSLILFYKKLSLAEIIIVFYSITIPLSGGLVSMPRYILAAFPLFILLAKVSEKKIYDDLITISFVLLQGFLFVFWVLGTYLVM